jgi:hypothetical protein
VSRSPGRFVTFSLFAPGCNFRQLLRRLTRNLHNQILDLWMRLDSANSRRDRHCNIVFIAFVVEHVR